MRKIYSIIIMMAVCLTAFANGNRNSKADKLPGHFLIEEGNIVWQAEFRTIIDFENVTLNAYEFIYKGRTFNDNEFLGRLENYMVHPDGKNIVSIPAFISDSMFEANVKIEFKTGIYRVTLTNIIALLKSDTNAGRQGDIVDIESRCLNSDKEVLEILDRSLMKSFTFTKDKWL